MGELPFRVNDLSAVDDLSISDELSVGGNVLIAVGALHLGGVAVTATAADLNTSLQTVAVDGITITGDGTVGNPLVAVGGGGGGSIGDPVTGGLSGSVLFVDASGN